ncbi:MAG: hypothetical protein AB7G68_20895 [Nitrospiraceae bacterium]
MIRKNASCILHGERFSPRLAEQLTGIEFVSKDEPGEIGGWGRYKGKRIDYGSARIKPPETAQSSKAYDERWMVELLEAHIDQFRACGATNIVMYLAVEWEAQCNFEFDAGFLARLAKLNIPLAISCYEIEKPNGASDESTVEKS